MKTRFGKIIYWTACFLLTSGLSTYAAETAQVTVRYGDLNVTQEQGARSLLARLDRAATHVCGGQPRISDLHAWMSYEACRKATMDHAVATVKAPLVARLYGTPIQPVIVVAAQRP